MILRYIGLNSRLTLTVLLKEPNSIIGLSL